MENNIKKLKDTLEKDKNNFLILTKRIPQVYSQYKVNPINEYKQQFTSLQQQLNKSFSDLFINKNQILNLSDEMSTNMIGKDMYISYAEKTTEERNNFLKQLEGKELASGPREKEIETVYNIELTLITINSLFLLGYGYLFYNLFKQ